MAFNLILICQQVKETSRLMIWMKSILTIIILGAGCYFWRKSLSRVARAAAIGLALSTCAILWLVAFAPDAPMKVSETEDQSQILSQPLPKQTITGLQGGITPPAPDRPTAQAATAREPPNEAGHAPAPLSDAMATTNETAEPDSYVAKVDGEQLEALIGDAVAAELEGSTIVNTIVKKGPIQKAEQDSPSEYNYSFPEVVEGPDGMVMIIPGEPLPAMSSRRQLTTGDDDIPGTGDVVALTYDMFSWSTGEMVESSQTVLNGPLMYRLGGKDSPIGIPQYLDKAVHNRPFGSTVQVIFERGMEDLPVYMDRNDGYVLVVRVDRPDTDGDAAFENMMNQAMNQAMNQ